MRQIYISPHLDDAVLCAGGLISDQARAGGAVEIWTIMCGIPPYPDLSPFAQVLHHIWGMTSAAEVVSVRRAEDLKAATLVGAGTLHFEFPDCIYRRGENGDWLYSDVFVHPHQDEAGLVDQIAKSISVRLEKDDQLFCLLGIGSHVDHVLVRLAVEKLNQRVNFLPDIPYVFKYHSEIGEKTAGMQVTNLAVSEEGLHIWKQGVAAYTSQRQSLEDLVDGVQKIDQLIDQYWMENGHGLGVWRIV